MARSVMPARAVALMQGQGSKAAGAAPGDGMLKGVCDIHLHCRPDSRERSADEFGFMQDAVRAGYRAVMFKSNDFSCHDRAYIIRQALPGAQCFGSVCMNRVHGDKVNVFAAQKAVQTSGGLCRCIWMPTLDAAYHCRWGEGTGMPQYRRQGIAEFAAFVGIDPSRSFVSTDLGQAVMPHPVEGMRDCISRLQGAGVAIGDIDRLVRRNPAWLLGLDKQE